MHIKQDEITAGADEYDDDDACKLKPQNKIITNSFAIWTLCSPIRICGIRAVSMCVACKNDM